MPSIIGAGLVPLSVGYLLVTTIKTWGHWRIVTIHQGSLSELACHAQCIPVALAVADDQLVHWTEDFPAHLSKTAIHRYLCQSKAELLASQSYHLTLSVSLLGQIQQIHCWLLNPIMIQQLCQPYQAVGFRIQALEPISYLHSRQLPPCQDKNGLRAFLAQDLQPAIDTAIKLACRTDWASEPAS